MTFYNKVFIFYLENNVGEIVFMSYDFPKLNGVF